jgi:hypothetical protein
MIDILKSVHNLRVEMEREEDDPVIVDGITVTTKFCCDFGFQSRNTRFYLYFDNVHMGFKEVYVPWSIFKETQENFVLIHWPLTEEIQPCEYAVYSETPMWFPTGKTIEEIVERYKKLKSNE